MSHVMHRSLRAVPPVAVAAHGIEIVDSAGRRYIDASGGAAVSGLGHRHPHVVAAPAAQIDRIAVAPTRFFSTDVAAQVAEAPLARAPAGITHVYPVSGG